MVTTADDGSVHGSTVQAFLSVSLSPPLVLISLSLTGRTYRHIQRSGVFAVNILSENQGWIAQRFADPTIGHEERFKGVGYYLGVTGCPILRDTCGYVECVVENVFEVVDHALVVGRVVGGAEGPSQLGPLVYYSRGYRRLRPD